MESVMFCFILISFIGINHGFLVDGQQQTLEDRITHLESELTVLRQELLTVQRCSMEFCELHWSKWSVWSTWTQCTGQCTSPGYKSHEQTRTRTRKCNIEDPEVQGIQCLGDASESEKRPCNAVELYGCLSPNTNYTNNQFSYVYNFFDELAQSACVGAVKSPAHVLAIRRNCGSGHALNCAQICANQNTTCFDELHVYQPNKLVSSDLHQNEGERGLMMYRYFSCAWSTGGCGPNFCCCKY